MMPAEKRDVKVRLLKRGVGRSIDRKEKWVTVGTAFFMPSGQINIVLDTLPVLQDEWDGGTLVIFMQAVE